ncbi:MAG TPA: YciI family protein [Luteibacter sp.]|jgi:uncharacterized protein YciI|nr:YciI family protein [Luteibacter sp.]
MNRFLILVMRTPKFDESIVGPHRAFLDDLRAQGQLEMTGPFTDGSGGAYLLLAEDMDTATAIAHTDPAHLTGASKITIHQWQAR